MLNQLGFRINTKIIKSLDKEVMQGFANTATANIGDVISRQFCISNKLKCINTQAIQFYGPAITVFLRNGDNLLLYKAIDLAKKGDVIVVNAKGCLDNAVMGEIMMRWAESKQIAAFIINGAVRDVSYLSQSKVAIYARGVTPAGPYKDGIGEINYPVSIEGIVIQPADIIIGDADGIVVVPQIYAEDTLAKVRAIEQKETEIINEINCSKFSIDWVDKRLKELMPC